MRTMSWRCHTRSCRRFGCWCEILTGERGNLEPRASIHHPRPFRFFASPIHANHPSHPSPLFFPPPPFPQINTSFLSHHVVQGGQASPSESCYYLHQVITQLPFRLSFLLLPGLFPAHYLIFIVICYSLIHC